MQNNNSAVCSSVSFEHGEFMVMVFIAQAVQYKGNMGECKLSSKSPITESALTQ